MLEVLGVSNGRQQRLKGDVRNIELFSLNLKKHNKYKTGGKKKQIRLYFSFF